MKQAIDGNQLAFAALVQRYRPMVFQQALQYTRDHDLADEVTQSVFLQLHLTHPEPRVTLKGWLTRVVYTRSIDALRLRRRNRRMLLFSELEPLTGKSASSYEATQDVSQIANIRDSQALPDEVAENRDLQLTLHKAIQALPPKWRTIVLMRYIDQLTYPEIGKRLNMLPTTAKSYFQRARPLLRNALLEEL